MHAFLLAMYIVHACIHLNVVYIWSQRYSTTYCVYKSPFRSISYISEFNVVSVMLDLCDIVLSKKIHVANAINCSCLTL